MLGLLKDRINAFETRWFFYDEDACAQDPINSYQFCAVHRDQIIREEVRFFDSSDSGFDPTVFDSGEGIQPIWFNHARWDLAWTAFWYRRFYKETRPGQLMVLRPDNPVLHYYPEARQWNNLSGAVSNAQMLSHIRLQLWVAIALFSPHCVLSPEKMSYRHAR